MPFHPQLNPQFPLDPLYCEEEECHWDDNERDSSNADNYHNAPPLDLDSSWEDEELASLLHKEQENQQEGTAAPHHQDPATAKARGDAVEWMLKVVHYYSFSVLTAVLAVNYLDRFLQSFKSHGENKEKKKPWMTQLAAVACISLAAKVEETHVPLLLDLQVRSLSLSPELLINLRWVFVGAQVEESDYVFESKTIQRMEILVLSTLQWRMNPVTPISFLDCIASKLGFFGQISREFLRRCHCLLLSLLSGTKLRCSSPSLSHSLSKYFCKSHSFETICRL